ncbi:MAG: hypothetical protein ABEJ65_08315 [bacterium]
MVNTNLLRIIVFSLMVCFMGACASQQNNTISDEEQEKTRQHKKQFEREAEGNLQQQ